MQLRRYLAPLQGFQGGGQWFPSAVYAFAFSISAYLAAFKQFDRSMDFLEEMRPIHSTKNEFDFIIVGAGSAGSVLANRLSEKYDVLLLEAGGDPHPVQLMPMFATALVNHEEIDWRFKSVSQKHSTFAQNNGESLLSQGLGLGGTSNINYMMQSRGHPKDFETWARLSGDSDWNYDNLLPFFKKHENYIRKPVPATFRSDEFDEDVHGYGGELNVEVPDYTNMGDTFLEAVQELGYAQVDLNGRYTEGFDYSYNTIKFGRRQSAYSAFLEKIINRRSLTIRKFAFVKKILFGNENVAYGVNYDHHGISKTAVAKREVIICAGALQTPKLLMLSGIGPKNHLESLGISVVKDLPVGKNNLMDHAGTYFGPFFVNQSITFNLDRDLNAFQLARYLSKGQGPITSTSCSAFGFIATKLAKVVGEGDYPNIQLVLAGTSMCAECDRSLAEGFNFNKTIVFDYYKHAKGRESFIILVSNARPISRGYIKLQSSDAYQPAEIDPNYLDNKLDVITTIEGMKKAIEIVEETETFKKVGGHFTDVPFPGCEDKEFRSDAYFECYLRQYTVSLHHFSGTCPMGISPELGGVVNSKLQVFGTKRLRIADASIMPLIPVGNTNAPTFMIGEKAADLILKLWEEDDASAKRKKIVYA